MTTLEELKKQRREIDARIKEIENPNYIRCGNARYEHRVYPTGKTEEIIAVNRPRKLRSKNYSEWWGNTISAQTKEELVERLRGIIKDMQMLLEKLEEQNEIQ